MNIYLKIKKRTTGRIGRKAFFLPGLACISFITILGSFSASFIVFNQGDFLNLAISLFLLLLVLYYLLPAIIKRFHDFGLSGWFCLFILIPPLFSDLSYLTESFNYELWHTLIQNPLFLLFDKFLSGLYLLTILFICLIPGQKTKNKYGEVSVYRKNKWRILGWIVFVILFSLSWFTLLFQAV